MRLVFRSLLRATLLVALLWMLAATVQRVGVAVEEGDAARARAAPLYAELAADDDPLAAAVVDEQTERELVRARLDPLVRVAEDALAILEAGHEHARKAVALLRPDDARYPSSR